MLENLGAGGVPRVPADALPRPRLLARLASWPDITVVQGPAGSGKTTLLAAWAGSLPGRAAWCEPVDGDLPFPALEAFAAAGPGAIVVDRAERLDAERLERLGRLVDRSPALRLAVATRSTRTAAALAAAGAAAVDVISPAELLFAAEELGGSGALGPGDAPGAPAAPYALDDDTRAAVIARSGGLAIAVRGELDRVLGRVSGVRDRLAALLRAEFAGRPDAYESVLRIALLPEVDAAILDAWAIPEDLLDELEAAGVGAREEDRLRVHPFVRGVLLEEAGRRVEERERHRLVAAAVRSSLIERDPLEGLRQALEMGDAPLATEVVLANMVELLEQRDAAYEVFRRSPVPRSGSYPALTVMLILLSNMDPDTRPRALQLLAAESLLQRLQPRRGSDRERAVYRAFEASVLRLTPFSARALPLIRRAFAEFSELDEHDMAALGRAGPMMQVHLGISAFYLGDSDLARQCFDIAYANHLEAGRADRVDPLSLRAGLAALTGDLPLARRLLREADAAEWPAGWRDSSPADFFNLGLAVLAIEEGRAEDAEHHLDAAGPIADLVEHWTFYGLFRARRDRLAGDSEVGLMRLHRLRQQRGSSPGTALAKSMLDLAEAELHLAAGRAEPARRIAARSVKHNPSCRIALAHAELMLDRPSEAAAQAQQVLKGSPTLRNRLEAELVLACAALRIRHEHDAEAVAARIAELLRTTELKEPLRAIPPGERGALNGLLARVGVEPIAEPPQGSGASHARPGPASAVVLTRREQAVLDALCETGALDEIAARLFVSRNTVKTQLRSVYRKLGVSSREAAVTRAAVLGLVEDPGA